MFNWLMSLATDWVANIFRDLVGFGGIVLITVGLWSYQQLRAK